MFDFFSKEDKQLYNMLGHLNMAEKEISLKDNSETEIYEVAGPDDKYAFLHEAAIIEYHITLVLLKPVIIMMILLAVGKIFYSDFGLFYQVTQNSGAIYSTTNTIDTYVYRTLIQTGDVGMSAAAGVYQSVVGFLIVLITNLLLRKISPEDSLF